jgi:hypothetical protein
MKLLSRTHLDHNISNLLTVNKYMGLVTIFACGTVAIGGTAVVVGTGTVTCKVDGKDLDWPGQAIHHWYFSVVMC